MNLDSKTKGQLGMQTNGGVWHRIALYDTKRRRGPSKPRRKPAVWEGEKVAAKPVTMKTFVADGYTEKAGKHIAKVIQAATRTEAIRLGKVWAERSNVAPDRFEVRLAVMG